MDERIIRLHAMGCNTEEALERMVDDEEFYIECLQEALQSSNFAQLKEAVSEGNVSLAFDCAHALKGLLGNVGLTPMFQKDVEIVEPLRHGSCDHLLEKVEQLEQMRVQFTEIVS